MGSSPEKKKKEQKHKPKLVERQVLYKGTKATESMNHISSFIFQLIDGYGAKRNKNK